MHDLVVLRAAIALSSLIALTGCSMTPIPPTYTQDELKAICERRKDGWWHPDGLVGGFCDYGGHL